MNADMQADCEGHMHVDFHGVLQLKATVTFTSTMDTTATFMINETVPLMSGSLDFTAQTEEQTALICDISQLVQKGG